MTGTKPGTPPGPPVVNPTPKQILMADARLLARHRDLMQLPDLMRSIELAEAQCIRTMTSNRTPDGNTAASNFFRIEGIHLFIQTLKSLGESPNRTTPTPPDNINHKA